MKTESGKIKSPAGSRMHILDWVESNDFTNVLQELLKPSGFTVQPDAERMPKGKASDGESMLTGIAETFLTPHQKGSLRSWWLAHTESGKLPTWDLVVTATDSTGNRGLVLVEAKAHEAELCYKGKKKPHRTTADQQQRSDANHEKIQVAISQACSALQKSIPNLHLSRDQSYQFCNRVAFAWKLATMNIPVALIYLGFLNDSEINGGTCLRSNQDWQKAFAIHTKNHFPSTHLETEIQTSGSSFWLFVRSLEAKRSSPSIEKRRIRV